MAFAWIFPAFVLGIIPTIQGINESASVTSYKPITTEPSLQTSIKPHISVISTINTGSHTHQVDDNACNTISNISVVHTVQASYSSNEGSHWATMPTPLRLGMTTTFIGSSVTGNLQSASIDFKDTTNMNQKLK
ncbi:hypothetical protein OS493_035706 [Desmophyllum pertusum]|uniref:Uncharacterized protein n=1 Tax=Desmophyllum pertusum TaxID=174260 RepID=A0A9W9YLH7_9CNID|nr:hypothetical protein OS493_035706 [Desmophyllum pertusum]